MIKASRLLHVLFVTVRCALRIARCALVVARWALCVARDDCEGKQHAQVMKLAGLQMRHTGPLLQSLSAHTFATFWEVVSGF